MHERIREQEETNYLDCVFTWASTCGQSLKQESSLSMALSRQAGSYPDHLTLQFKLWVLVRTTRRCSGPGGYGKSCAMEERNSNPVGSVGHPADTRVLWDLRVGKYQQVLSYRTHKFLDYSESSRIPSSFCHKIQH